MIVSILNKRQYDPICSTRRIFFFAVLIMIPLSLAGWRITSVHPETQSFFFSFDKALNAERFSNPLNWFNILFLGVVASGICFTIWNKACNILGTVKVSCGLYLIPVVTITFAFLALGEEMTLLGGAGAALTITGLFISEKK